MERKTGAVRDDGYTVTREGLFLFCVSLDGFFT